MKQILFILIFISSLISSAQPPSKFYCRYGGNGYDVGNDVKQTLDGGYIITGSTSSFGYGNTDMHLLKLDSIGQKKFETSFGGVGNEIGKSVVQLADSSYVIVGYTSSTGVGGYDVFLVKADKNGALVWQKTIGGSDWDFANSIQQTADGGFIIAGTTYSYGRGNADGYIIKTDVNGNVTWSKTYGGKKDDEFKSIIQTSDLNYALAGYTKSYNDSLGDALLFRIDGNGDSLYSSTIGGNYFDYFNNVIELPNTNLYFVGANFSQTNGLNSKNWRYLINSANTTLINDFIGNTNIERYNASAVGINGIIVTVGYNNYLGTSADANIHVYNSNLSYKSYFPFGVENSDELFSISKTKDKGFVCIGTCIGNTSFLNDLLFAKIDSLGNYGSSIIGIDELDSNAGNNKITIYPNPSSNVLNIYLQDFAALNDYKYNLIDINGRIVLSENISESKSAIKTNMFDSGLYFLMIYKSDKLIYSSKFSIIAH